MRWYWKEFHPELIAFWIFGARVVWFTKMECNFIAFHIASPQPLSTSNPQGLPDGEGLNLALASGLEISCGKFFSSSLAEFAARLWEILGQSQGI